MNYEDYKAMYNQILRLDKEFDTVVLPIELKQGESEDEAFLRFLVEEDFVETKGDLWRIKNREKIEKFNPNLLKVLDAMVMATVRAELDELIELGYVYMTADEEGNIIYELTEAGEAYVEDED
jgi:hypothetical protein